MRSYLILDPLIWLYTLVMGLLALPGGLFDRNGRRLHWFSYAWSWLIMKTIFSPVKVTGLDQIDTSKPHVYAANHASALDIPVLYVNLPVSVPHCVQEGTAVVSGGGLATEALGTDLH